MTESEDATDRDRSPAELIAFFAGRRIEISTQQATELAAAMQHLRRMKNLAHAASAARRGR